MEKNNKKAPSKGHGHRISDGNEGSYSIKLPSKREGSFQEKRKKDSDRCYDFTNDNVINPPKENTRKK
ncbi:hypothetical protein [Bacteroides thetaiotaomicron]|jgi:hypothetical protein|uniref:Uncharacterized protein n=1 Tax=Bacteroides thetaiotaomicron TaxID=818 RepID=A0A139KAW6_BACT4|nr:hypothetical protein [Bacteroides thetaiotaomicron]KAB4458079.1 hypothetical protein GAN75_03100 [Bacteroides thetaiotaomicron]KXT36306.1 hypothetical protein HMPREF2534_02875 [Bacteroides thetaiotaomicron]MCA6026954.1 hypothetical protein [Bacteroides thetaiotaomicron]MCE9152865.1 hypothetical protein [Bacteroides thetaiotaomicron]MCS2954621.1 hypothetical protein [Bacteroides thetaiotaomicron]